MKKRAVMKIEQYDNGIAYEMTDAEGQSKRVVMEGQECNALGIEFWESVKMVMNEAPSNQVKITMDIEVDESITYLCQDPLV